MEEKAGYAKKITQEIINQIQNGTVPWMLFRYPGELQPAYNPVSGKEFKGFSQLSLSMQGKKDPRWVTFAQAKSF